MCFIFGFENNSMPADFSDSLVVGISSRALFNLEEENSIFRTQGVKAYREYQRSKENDILLKGTAFYLVEALLNLNKLSDQRLVEVIVMSRNSPETGMRVLNSIDHYKLDATRSCFTGGNPLHHYMMAYHIDLFLSKEESDVQKVIDSKTAAAAIIYDSPKNFIPEVSTVRIAFDGDAVLFSEESEFIYKSQGMQAFHDNESANVDVPLNEGPYAKLLKKLSMIQEKMKTGIEESPLRLALITARNSPSHIRVIKTFRKWGVYVDEAHFLGGISKDQVLKAFNAHIFFDDQDVHLDPAKEYVPSAKVPYPSGSPLLKSVEETVKEVTKM
jgi:5'-nucleotidase